MEVTTMASINKKIKKGHPYYYAMESARVNGKPRIVWQKYLGTIESIIHRAEDASPPLPKETVIFQAGGVAALLGITQRLGLIELINRFVPKRNQGPSVGHYMVLAALNRALSPCSKVLIGDWYEETVLRRLWRFKKSAFSSQRFWDHMDMVSAEAIDRIQQHLALRIRDQFGLDAEVLLYDTTNFFTFLATTNDRCSIAQRGRSKNKRHDLRQVGLAILISRALQIPLFHRTYPGNIPDVSLFPELATELLTRYEKALGRVQDATLVFDKGNVSDDGMEHLIVPGHHFVAALRCNRCPELFATPLAQFQQIPTMPGTRAFTEEIILWEKTCRAVVCYTDSFFAQQLSGITTNLVKCQKQLRDRAKALDTWRQGKGRGKKPTLKAVRSSVRRILSPQFMTQLFDVRVDEYQGFPRLCFTVNHAALQQLTDHRLGRTLIVSDHRDWTPAQIIATYRSLTDIEDIFRDMKNVNFLRWQPAYHWTNQKIIVHGFYCVLGLLMASLARAEAVRAGIDLHVLSLMKELTKIREVAVVYPRKAGAQPRDRITLSRMSARQRKLAECLHIAEILAG
jgi:transposase